LTAELEEGFELKLEFVAEELLTILGAEEASNQSGAETVEVITLDGADGEVGTTAFGDEVGKSSSQKPNDVTFSGSDGCGVAGAFSILGSFAETFVANESSPQKSSIDESFVGV
jgi:hypothetical protein